MMDKKHFRNLSYKAYQFEDLVRDIFKFLGYKIISQDEVIDKIDIDLLLEKNNCKYIIEVKYFTKSSVDLALIRKVENQLNPLIEKGYTPILVVSNVVRENTKYIRKDTKLKTIIDIGNLLYMVEKNSDLKSRLLETLEYSTQDIVLEEPKIDMDPVNEVVYENYSEVLINELNLIESGQENFQKYEECCFKILKYLFEEDLGIWQKQCKSNDDMYRFDLVCKIKSGDLAEFWDTLKVFFNCKYTIFEFKNYKDTITQQQIYTTEKYLYAKALRNVAIILSRKGVDINGLKAAKGTLRENGKLIIVLNDEDVINMIRLKNNSNDPADYLGNKLDQLLLELEK